MQTQQATRAPFFKPLSPPSAGLGNYTPDTSQEKQRTKNQTVRSKDVSWDTIQSVSLHARLQQEAEKIRRWKLSTELDLKQRERKITECQTTIEQQRKTIYDLQLETEGVTSQLQNELANQQEIQHKIEATRDMCKALKDHSVKVDESVHQGESDRLEMQTQHAELSEQVQHLVSKFRGLHLQCTTGHEDLVKKYEEEKAEMQSLKEQRECQLVSLQQEATVLQNTVTRSSEEAIRLRAEVQETGEARSILEETHATVCDRLKLTESISQSQVVQIESLGERLQTSENTVNELSVRVATLHNDLLSLNCEKKTLLEEGELEARRLSEQMAGVMNDVGILKERLMQEENKCAQLHHDLQSEELKYREMAEAKGHLEEEMRALLEKMNALSSTKESLESELETLTGESDAFRQKLSTTSEELKAVQESYEDIAVHLDDAHKDINDLKAMCNDMTNEKQALCNALEVLKDALASVQKDLETAQSSQRDIAGQLHETEKELDLSKSNCSQLEEEIGMRKECEATLRKECQSLSTTLDDAKSQIQRNQEAISEKDSELSELKSSSLQLQQEIDEAQQRASAASGIAGDNLEKKQQQIKTLKKDLADEVKKNRSNDKQIRSLEGKVETLEKDLTENTAKIEDLNQSLQSKDDELVTAKNKVMELKELQEKALAAIKSEQEAQERYEGKSLELCATLEKYQLENQKIVERKDKEVEELRARLSTMEQQQSEEQASKTKQRGEVQRLQQLLNEQKDAQDNMEKELKDKLLKFETMEMDVQERAKPAVSSEQAMETSPPRDSAVFKKLPRTPRAATSTPKPAANVQTPKQTNTRGSSSVSTPGILRTGQSSQPNKRKVIFAGDAAGGESPEDTTILEQVLKTPTIQTPTTKSPRSASTLSTPRSNVRHAPTTPTGYSPAAKTPKSATARSTVQEERDQFSDLFPEAAVQHIAPREKKRSSSLQSGRSTKKLKIKASDSAAKKPKRDQTNWFDTDPVFGFHPEE